MSKVVLLDGGMGQELLRRSTQQPHSMWSAKVLMDEPEIVEAVHTDYINAGARVITLNNYSVTPERLAREGYPELFDVLQRRAIDIAKRARDKSQKARDNDVNIAGCLPPLFASYKPELAPDFEECLEKYRVIADVQAAEVDLFICETMSSIKEGTASAMASQGHGHPVWLSLSLEDNLELRLRSGEPLTDAIETIKAKCKIDALLLNCSMPEAINAAMETLTHSFTPVGAYANGFTSIAALKPGGTVSGLTARNDLGPKDYAKFTMSWVNSGAKIVGGCCEVGPAHIAELERQLLEANLEVSSSL
ncbi:homocysteine S-methyltransferase [Alphaproteobacteria bacterium 46_93_T64]|nr:homocysteine S-methyltransferase [Alphaproteobacteria bacterium 46_93_T64]